MDAVDGSVKPSHFAEKLQNGGVKETGDVELAKTH